jgi:hypothetical protein
LQLGHLPIQRALVPPHSVQVNIDLSLAMERDCAFQLATFTAKSFTAKRSPSPG